jgi:cbb3-type cytochrome oxidase subunit 1
VLSERLIKCAAVYFLLGVGLGMYMGIAQDFRLVHVHAHINLLGWVALGLIGLIYRVYPRLAHGKLAQGHFWLHNTGLPIFMGGFGFGIVSGTKQVAPLAIGSSLVALSVVLFTVNVLLNLRPAVMPLSGGELPLDSNP